MGQNLLKKTLQLNNHDSCTVIIERDNINRDEYINPDLFIPDDLKLVQKINGYEIYQKNSK